MLYFPIRTLHVFIVFLWVLEILPGSLGDVSIDSDEEDTFVRSVVSNMYREGSHPFNVVLVSLTELTVRLEKIQIMVEEMSKRLDILETERVQHKRVQHKNPTEHASQIVEEANTVNVAQEEQTQISTTEFGNAEDEQENLGNLTVSIVPFDCGGVIIRASSFVLDFQAPYTLPYAYTCLWTFRIGTSQYIYAQLVEENFAVSKSKIRMLPMNGIVQRQYDGSTVSLQQEEWSAGGSRATHYFYWPILFVEFIMQGNSSTLPKFVISFQWAGNTSSWSGYSIQHWHLSASNGTVAHGSTGQNELISFAILPKLTLPREDSLGQGILNVNYNDGCSPHMDLRIWRIGSQSLLGIKDNNYSFCGQPNNLNNVNDDVGWIVTFYNWGHGEANFSFAYRTHGGNNTSACGVQNYLDL